MDGIGEYLQSIFYQQSDGHIGYWLEGMELGLIYLQEQLYKVLRAGTTVLLCLQYMAPMGCTLLVLSC